MWKRFFEAFVIAIILIIQELIGNFLSKGLLRAELMTEDWANLSGRLIAGAFAVLAVALFLVNQGKLRRSRFIRRRILRGPARFEGYWISSVQRDQKGENVPVSISKIYYSRSEEKWLHHGFEFDLKRNCIHEWVAKSIYYSDKKHLWFFRGSSWGHEKLGNEFASDRISSRSQMSVISTSRKLNDYITSRFFDEPTAAGKYAILAGRAQMKRIPSADMEAIFPNFGGAIEHPSIRMMDKSQYEALLNYLPPHSIEQA
ncbi:hypothetical protein AAG614_13605 [Citromicrobium bathyomarinum]